jgi:molybdenum cofactor cytidylyltransferase
MKLITALRLQKTSRVAFVGSGGKTTALSQISGEWNNTCIISTTTHLGEWQRNIADYHLVIENSNDLEKLRYIQEGSILVTGIPKDTRLSGLSTREINVCLDICDERQIPLFLECDGSRQLPIKFPKSDEPVIPSFVDTVVVTCGLSGLNQPLDSKSTYQPELFSNFSGIIPGQDIKAEGLIKVILHQKGGLKNIPKNARKIVLLNQADEPTLQAKAGEIALGIKDHYDSVVISSLLHRKVLSVSEPTAAIILAAGTSSRFGEIKQLLKFKEGTFLRSIINSSIMAGLSPIVVITGSDHDQISRSLKDFGKAISIVYNSEWQEGQSTSIRAGIKELEQLDRSQFQPFLGSVIFLLADQPQISFTLLEALVEQHARSLSPVIAPLVDGQRANPVLFDKVTFPSLKDLHGDIGGRGIFHTFPPTYLPWNDHAILLDVDTTTDYTRLLNEID